MDYGKSCKLSRECEKLEIENRREDKTSYDSEIEEGEFRNDDSFGLDSPVHEDMAASVIKLSSSSQVEVEEEHVNARQSTSPERGSHQGETANNTVKQSKYGAMKHQSVNVRQPYRRCYEERQHSYSPSFHINSKERHEKRTRNCFRYCDYRHVREKIEKVCSERLVKLLLHQKKDCNEFKALQKKQESEFFREHALSYKVHYERVIPTIKYHRKKLPRVFFCILREIFNKHFRSQLRKFCNKQVNDRNKEKMKKERWIFEASAGYLKKNFYETSLTYSGFEMEKPKWHVHDYFEVEEQLKFLDMQSLATEIEAIASSRQVEENHKESERDGSRKHELSVDVAEAIATIGSKSSQSNHAPLMGCSEEFVSQFAISQPPRNEAAERSSSSLSLSDVDKALELANAVATGSEDAPSIFGEKRRRMCSSDDTSGSCSGSKGKFPDEHASNFNETGLHHEEPRAPRPPSINVNNQMEQADDTGSKDKSSGQTSCFAQVNKEQNSNANSSMSTPRLMQLQHCDLTCQNAAHTCEPSMGNTCAESTRLDSPGAANIQRQSVNQTMTSSQVEQYFPENRFQSEPVTSELRQMLMSPSDDTSAFAQITEHRNDNANSSSLTQQRYCDQAWQAAYQYQLSGMSTFSVRTGLDSTAESNVEQPSANQTIGGIAEQYMPESGPQADPFIIELNRLRMLHDVMTKRHLSRKQKILLDYEKEVAETNRKYEEQIRKIQVETLEKEMELQILQDKVHQQQMLAEALQDFHKPAGNASCSQTGALERTMGESSSDQQVSRLLHQ